MMGLNVFYNSFLVGILKELKCGGLTGSHVNLIYYPTV